MVIMPTLSLGIKYGHLLPVPWDPIIPIEFKNPSLIVAVLSVGLFGEGWEND